MTTELVISPELLQLALGLNRILTYVGYVLLAGTFAFWSLVWPEGRADRRLVALSAAGISLLAIGTLGGPAIQLALGGRLLGDALSPLDGAAGLVRLAVLVGAAFFFADVVRFAVLGWRRVFALAVVAMVAATMVAQSNAVAEPWRVAKIMAMSGHVVATATWIGGLVALAAAVLARENLPQLEQLIPRFSLVATVSVIILLGTGAVHGLAVAGGLRPLATSMYGLVLLIKIAVVGIMLVLGSQGRRYAARIAFQRVHQPSALASKNAGVHSLAVVIWAELAISFVILATTAILVMVAPHP